MMDLVLVEKTLLGLFAAIIVAIVVSKLRGKRLKLPLRPLPVPIFGNWLQVGDDLNHRNLTALARRFGDILLLRMGQRNLVVVSSLDLARDVLHTQGVEFGSLTRNVIFDIFNVVILFSYLGYLAIARSVLPGKVIPGAILSDGTRLHYRCNGVQ